MQYTRVTFAATATVDVRCGLAAGFFPKGRHATSPASCSRCRLPAATHLGDKRETAVGMTKALRGLHAAIDIVPPDPDSA